MCYCMGGKLHYLFMFEYENVRQEGQRWGGFTLTGFCVVCCLPFFLCRLPSRVSVYMVDCICGHGCLTRVKFVRTSCSGM